MIEERGAVAGVDTDPRGGDRPAAAETSVSVVIPAYNEEKGIGPVLAELARTMKATGWRYEIIVVDDGSSDTTAAVARESGVRVISHKANRGYGAALKSGIRAAAMPWILITDADGTYPSSAIPAILEATPGHEMVVGARIGENVQGPILRRPARWILRKLATYLSETDIPDLNSGLRIFRRDRAIQFFPILPRGFSFTTSITLALLCNDMQVAYLPIDYAHRTGRSKIRPIRDMVNFLLLIHRVVLYFNPLKIFLPVSMMILAGFAASIAWDVFVRNDLTEKTLILLFAGVQILAVGLLADMISKGPRMGAQP